LKPATKLRRYIETLDAPSRRIDTLDQPFAALSRCVDTLDQPVAAPAASSVSIYLPFGAKGQISFQVLGSSALVPAEQER
jgi:hypothetical protein